MFSKAAFLISFLVILCVSVTSFALDPTDDTFIDELNPANINGSSGSLITRSMYLGGYVIDTLLKYDLSWIPPDATVKSATITLFYSSYLTCDPVGNQLDAFRITEDWDEGTTNWNNRPSHNATPVATDYVPSLFSGMGWDVTSSVQDFVDGTYPNYGWKIRDVESSSTCMTYFRSEEYGGGFNPGLVIRLDIIFVDVDATGVNNGRNWTDAYTKLQDALSLAVSGDRIWVAEGTYKPDQGGSETPGDRGASFQLKNGVKIYGGFVGGETSLDQRDWQNNTTILSGDINTVGVDTDNSYHVVTGGGTGLNAVLDGFTITAGNANGTLNAAWGGGMYNQAGSPMVANCTFEENQAEYGGGMFNYNDVPKVINCHFLRNTANHHGGGVYNDEHVYPVFTNCLFYENTAGFDGGGVYDLVVSDPTFINCTFSENSASYDGGGIYTDSGSALTVINSILWGNSDSTGTGASAQIYNNGTLTVTYSCIQDDDPDDGSIPYGGVANNNIDDDPLFQDADSGDLRLSGDSPCVDVANDAAVPADAADVDTDNNVAEQTPLDLDLLDRFADGDCDGAPTVDMGAYELVWVYIGDLDGDCDVDMGDLSILSSHWLAGK